MPKGVFKRGVSELERFEVYFQKTEGCWTWKGASIPEHGNPDIRRARFQRGRRQEYAYRTAYRLYIGSIPKGLCICHRCDNGLCVNPEHLFLGTQKENSEDMVAKGHSTRGEKSPQHKITLEEAIEIKKIPLGTRGVSRRFGISRMHITRIRRNESWAWIMQQA